jgi:ATP-dependent Lon protease
MTNPSELPLFPLGLVVYPDELISLHIFEDRYKQLVRYCLDTASPFGIVLYDGGRMSNVGCACMISAVRKRYDDGTLDIEVAGTDRFRIKSITEDGSYLRCEVDWLPTIRETENTSEVQRLITQHMRLLELAGRTVRPERYDEAPLLSYFVARNSGLELPQKQVILETDTEDDRIAILIEHMTQFIPKVEHGEGIRKKVRSNGHFTDFPPEQL